MDRASASGAEGGGFESRISHYKKAVCFADSFLFLYYRLNFLLSLYQLIISLIKP